MPGISLQPNYIKCASIVIPQWQVYNYAHTHTHTWWYSCYET